MSTNGLNAYGVQRGVSGIHRVASMKEACELLSTLRCTRRFRYGYVSPASPLRVVAFYEATEAEWEHPPLGMVPTLLSAEPPVGAAA